MIVLDASVLIAHLDAGDKHHDRAFALLTAVADEQFVASPLTVAEVLVGPARAGLVERAAAALRDLQVSTVPIDDAASVRLAVLRADTGLKLPDCCVLLAAEQAAGAGVATFDDRLAAVARNRGLDVSGGEPGAGGPGSGRPPAAGPVGTAESGDPRAAHGAAGSSATAASQNSRIGYLPSA